MRKKIRGTAVVTGASSGIGQAIALSLLRHGYRVIAVGRNMRRLKWLAAHAASLPGACEIMRIDLERITQLERHRAISFSRYRAIDWVVHSAGYLDPAEPSHGVSPQSLSQIFKINTFAPILLTQVLKPRQGTIFISSTASLHGNQDFPLYAASKAALNGFAKSLAKKWEKPGRKKSIVICPGPTNTPMRKNIDAHADTRQEPDVVATAVLNILTGKLGSNGDLIVIKDGQVKTMSDQ